MADNNITGEWQQLRIDLLPIYGSKPVQANSLHGSDWAVCVGAAKHGAYVKLKQLTSNTIQIMHNILKINSFSYSTKL